MLEAAYFKSVTNARMHEQAKSNMSHQPFQSWDIKSVVELLNEK